MRGPRSSDGWQGCLAAAACVVVGLTLARAASADAVPPAQCVTEPDGGGCIATGYETVEIAPGPNVACPAVVVGAFVYFFAGDADQRSSSIRRVGKTGGPVANFAVEQPTLGGIAVDDERVYWTAFELQRDRSGSVRAADLAGGPVREIATGQAFPFHLASDEANLYWLEQGWSESPPRVAVVRAPKQGGPSITLVDEADDRGVGGLAVDATHVYWGSSDGLRRVSKSGGAAETIARDEFVHRPYEILLDDGFVYWSRRQGGIRKLAKTGGEAVELRSLSPNVFALAIDASSIYFGDDSAYIFRVPKTGGEPERLAMLPQSGAGRDLPQSIAVDASGIWVCGRSGIWRLAPTGGAPARSPPAASATPSPVGIPAIASERSSDSTTRRNVFFVTAALVLTTALFVAAWRRLRTRR